MKDMLVGIMVKVMPFMMPVFWIGVAFLAIALALLVFALFAPRLGEAAQAAALVGAGVGAFFLACQAMGYLLSVPPAINFANSAKFEFFLVPFWQVGLGLALPALIIHYLGRRIHAGA